MNRQSYYQQQIDRFLRLLAEAERFGPDLPEGTVLKFKKQFVEGGVKYSYAAIKANGLWYTTGPKSPKGYSWDEFIGWLNEGVPVKKLWVMCKDENMLARQPSLQAYAKADVETTTVAYDNHANWSSTSGTYTDDESMEASDAR